MFTDRIDAGRQLAAHLASMPMDDPIVLALPRGGVPVAAEVATALGAPLEVFVARKLGAPAQPELGIGALAEGGGMVVDDHALAVLGVSSGDLDRRVAEESDELERRVERYRGGRPLPELTGRDVVLVDDGLATGVTAEAALRALRQHEPRRLVLAVPVCAPDTVDRLLPLADHIVCVGTPADFRAVGRWYDRFEQTTDDEVVELLAAAR